MELRMEQGICQRDDSPTKSRKQPYAINWSSTQWENLAAAGGGDYFNCAQIFWWICLYEPPEKPYEEIYEAGYFGVMIAWNTINLYETDLISKSSQDLSLLLRYPKYRALIITFYTSYPWTFPAIYQRNMCTDIHVIK